MHKLTDDELIEELKSRFKENRNSLEELKDLNNQLIEVNKKLEESESLKSHFISNITNEIINPFTSILGLSKAIMDVDKENWKRVFSMVAMIYSEAFNLDFQFRNIFVAAKIEAGQIQPEIMHVDIDNILRNVIESFKFELKKKDISVEYKTSGTIDSPILFNSDPEKVKLIVSNLLSNAIKYSFDKGKILVSNHLESGQLKIIVKDQGEGISEENQKIIFERFKRLDNGINSINRGHGLGLSVNKALIDMLNGNVKINSEIENGSEFIITLPEMEANAEGFATDGDEFIFDEDSLF